MIQEEDVIKDLKLLVELIEDEKVTVTGFGVRRKFEEQQPEFADFDGGEAKLKDTGRRTLTLEFIE